MLILSFLALTPRLILGLLIIQALWKSADSEYTLIKLFIAGPLGIGLSSLTSFVWLWAGLDLGSYVLMEICVVAVWSICTLLKHKDSILIFLKGLISQTNKQNVLWRNVLAASLLIFTGGFWMYSLQNPHGKWDAWSNWNVVARFVFRGGEHWAGTFLRAYGHPDYPFLLAMSNAATWETLSRETTRGPMTLAFLFSFCLLGLVFSLVYSLRGLPQAAFATIVFASQPLLLFNGINQYADVPESFYFLASVGLIPIHISSREKYLPILAGFLTGLSAWTKNEGLTFVLINFLAWAFLANKRKDFTLKFFILGLTLPALVVVLFKTFLAPNNDLVAGQRDILALLLDLKRYGFILTHMGQAFWRIGGGSISLVGLLAAYSFMVGKTHQSLEGLKLLMFVVLAQLSVYFFVYVTTPYDLEWHIQTSVGRLYFHLLPIMLLGLFLWLKTPNELLTEVK